MMTLTQTNRNLRSGELTPLYIPSLQAQGDRSLVRMRIIMVKKQTRCKNQLKALLTFYGIEIPDKLANSNWSKQFISRLDLTLRIIVGNRHSLLYYQN